MMCYKDMTFCTYYKDCYLKASCPRPLTPEVQAGADEWWEDIGGDAPIAIFTKKPICWGDENEEDS
jgi:hypothetical protein